MVGSYQQPNFTLLIKSIKAVTLGTSKFLDEFNRKEAELYRDAIKGHIDAQDMRWIALSSNYLAKKKKEGLKEGMWQATEDLYKSLEVHKDSKGRYYVGGSENEIHEPSGLLINKLISIHEYGNTKMNIPSRKLFRPTRDELQKTMNDRFIAYSKEYFNSIFK